MKVIEIPAENGGSWLQIPDGWDVFIYRGFLYVRLDDGTFACVEELPQ